jgi:hypothetical protein
MFFGIKPSGGRRYTQIFENIRNGARSVQRVIATLGPHRGAAGPIVRKGKILLKNSMHRLLLRL